jgi:hypothetical protein
MKIKFNVDDYRKNKDELVTHLRKNNHQKWEKLSDDISVYCACYGLPNYAAYTFVMEEFPIFTDDCKKKLVSLKEFYGYE